MIITENKPRGEWAEDREVLDLFDELVYHTTHQPLFSELNSGREDPQWAHRSYLNRIADNMGRVTDSYVEQLIGDPERGSVKRGSDVLHDSVAAGFIDISVRYAYEKKDSN